MESPTDVLIVLAHGKELKFHSSVLRRHSARFNEYLTQENAMTLSSKARAAGVTHNWRVDLRDLPPKGPRTGKLHLVEINRMGTPVNHTPVLPINENGKVPSKIYEYYDSILHAFYGNEITISDTNISSTLQDTVAMTEIGEYLGSIATISKSIDVALFKQGQTLFRSIAGNPCAWVNMAVRIKSDTIYKESIIHLAGNWGAIKDEKKAQLNDTVVQVCAKHHEKLTLKRKKLECGLAAFYPGGMMDPTGKKEYPIKREEFAKDILVWMALCFLRHWYGQQILEGKGAAGPDGGYNLYKRLGEAGDAYMDRQVLQQFHDKFRMTRKAMNVLETHLLEIKMCIKDMVAKHKIMATELQLDIHRYEVQYLTCVYLDKEDYPWKTREEPECPRTRAPTRALERENARVQSAQDDADEEEEEEEEEVDDYNNYDDYESADTLGDPLRGNGSPKKRTRSDLFPTIDSVADEDEDMDENADNKRAREE